MSASPSHGRRTHTGAFPDGAKGAREEHLTELNITISFAVGEALVLAIGMKMECDDGTVRHTALQD